MNVSVVVNTYNRCASLSQTLDSLFRQVHSNTEIIVVNGPSTDDTNTLLSRFSDRIKIIPCPARNLSISRNLGIGASSGEIIAFIDDDAIASPHWISDLVNGYDDETIAGVGGLVYDNTGMAFQYSHVVCRRLGGIPIFDIDPGISKYNTPGADPFLHLIGTNASFRKNVLIEVGGFDEEYDYFLDETDLCMRMIDAGYKLKSIDSGYVHHKFMPSHIRGSKGVTTDPYSCVKNILYFTIKNFLERNVDYDANELKTYIEGIKNEGMVNFQKGRLSSTQYRYFLSRYEQGLCDGKIRAHDNRKMGDFSSNIEMKFLPIPKRSEKHYKIVFACNEYPTDSSYGGIGRYTYDLAHAFTRLGHEVHVIYYKNDGSWKVDYDQGVFVHSVSAIHDKRFKESTLYHRLVMWLAIWTETKRIHAERAITIMSGPLWTGDTILAALSRSFPVVLTFMTSHKIMSKLTPDFIPRKILDKLLTAERLIVESHMYGHAISDSIKEHVEFEYGTPLLTFVRPLCIEGITSVVQDDHNAIRILCVGRIEYRKGIDLLVDAARKILREMPNAEFHFAGRDPLIAGYSPIEKFLLENANSKDLIKRFCYHGEVSIEELNSLYSSCDILCMPSRYESFGLVLLEGMAHGLPCVATDAGGMKEIVVHNQTGLIVPSEDVDSLTEALSVLCLDSDLRKRMGHAGLERFQQLFESSSNAAQLEKDYEAVINNFKQYKDSSDKLLIVKVLEDVLDTPHQLAVSYADLLEKDYSFGYINECKEKRNTFLRRVLRGIDRNVFRPFFRSLKKRYKNEKVGISTPLKKTIWQELRDVKSNTECIKSELKNIKLEIDFARNDVLFEIAHNYTKDPKASWKIKNSRKVERIFHEGSPRLNIGCGHKAKAEYLNVDFRDLEGVDIIGSADDIHFPECSLDGIFSSHLMEHFTHECLRRRLIPHWYSRLRTGGILHTIVPDTDSMIRAYAMGDMQFNDLRDVLFGLQDYGQDFHYTMFSQQSYESLVREAGFADVRCLTYGRRNGLCYEMEIVCTKK